MRAGLIVALVAVALSFGPSSSAGVFPDLPGADMLEEAIVGREVADQQTGHAPAPDTSDDRVPAPDPSADAEEVTAAAADEGQLEIVTALPGGGGLPIIKDVAPTAQGADVAPLAVLAALVVLAFTRFLYRLNEIGRRA
jgi:hypothetical protein